MLGLGVPWCLCCEQHRAPGTPRSWHPCPYMACLDVLAILGHDRVKAGISRVNALFHCWSSPLKSRPPQDRLPTHAMVGPQNGGRASRMWSGPFRSWLGLFQPVPCSPRAWLPVPSSEETPWRTRPAKWRQVLETDGGPENQSRRGPSRSHQGGRAAPM